MAGNKIAKGQMITAVAAAVVVSGQGVLMGSLFGVASTDAEVGEEFEMDTCGVYELPKVAADDIAAGAKVYWKASSGEVTSTASGNTLIGCITVAAGNGVTSARVRLNGTV